jgi:hypothetical protein
MQRFISCLAAICAASALVACSNSDNGGNHGSGGSTANGGASQGGSTAANGGSVSANGGNSASGGSASGGAPMGGAASGGAANGGAANGGSSNAGANSGGAASGGAAGGGTAGGAAGAATGGGAGATTGGSGGGGNVELKMPIERSGKYVLEFGDVLFEVDPAVSARIITFSLKGSNAITHDASTDMDNQISYGSTFWPSPQSAWDKWPPIPETDNQAYTPSIDGNSIVMTQSMSPSARNKLSVTKRFTPVLNAQAVDIQYTLTNKDSAAASWAPWEITRVPTGGLTLFTTGTKVITLADSDALKPTGRTMNQDGVTWYKNMSGDKGKYSADCLEGWLAHASSGLLLVKRFMDVPVAELAPGEGDCEFYAGNGYVELENQGAYGSVAANGSLSWTVRWYLRNLSDPSIATVGNASLVSMVRDVIKQ